MNTSRTEVISDTQMHCRAPLLFDVLPDAQPPLVPWLAGSRGGASQPPAVNA